MWYSIEDIPAGVTSADASLLVSYANLLTEYGWQSGIADIYKQLQGDGVGPLSWQSGNRIEGLQLSQDSDQRGWPLSDPSIVVFDVDGSRLACFVQDVDQHIIVDSTDGQLKPGSTYGRPVGWAAFAEPTLPAAVPDIPASTTPPSYSSNVVGGIAYVSLGKPQRKYVCKPEGIDLTDFSGYISTFRDFVGVPNSHLSYGAEVRVIGIAKHPVLPNGQEFWMTLDDWGDFGRTGNPVRLHGYVRDHLSDQKPSALSPKVAAPAAAAPLPQVTPVPATDNDFVSTFKYLRGDRQPVRYRVLEDMLLLDLMTRDESRAIKVTAGTTIAIYGTFWSDGNQFMLPRLDGEAIGIFDYWFGIPEADDNGKLYLEKIPDLIPKPAAMPPVAVVRPPRQRRMGVDDIIVNVSTLFEVTFVRGIVKLKKHVERIKQWK